MPSWLSYRARRAIRLSLGVLALLYFVSLYTMNRRAQTTCEAFCAERGYPEAVREGGKPAVCWCVNPADPKDRSTSTTNWR